MLDVGVQLIPRQTARSVWRVIFYLSVLRNGAAP